MWKKSKMKRRSRTILSTPAPVNELIPRRKLRKSSSISPSVPIRDPSRGKAPPNFGPPHSSSTRTSLTPEDSFDHSKSETFACFSISTKRINLFVVKLRFKLEIYSIVGNVENWTLETEFQRPRRQTQAWSKQARRRRHDLSK